MGNNTEQIFYDNLRKKPISELVKRVKQIESTIYNLERESDMIRNILLLTGEYVPAHYITDFEFGKFYLTNHGENYGTEIKER